MKRFTIKKFYPYNQVVHETIKLASNEIQKSYSSNIEAIVVFGSFGRGEGRLYLRNSDVLVFNDIDFLVVLKKTVKNIQAQNKKCITNILNIIDTAHIDIKYLLVKELRKLELSMDNYDIKYGGQVIYGNQKILDSIKIERDENLHWLDGRRLLLNRLVTFLEAKELTEVHKKQSQEFFTYYQCSKVIFACIDCILIMYNDYATKYSEKYNKFMKYSKSYKPYIKLCREAYEIKLGLSDISSLNPTDFWLLTGQLYIKIIFEYFKNSDEITGVINNKMLKDYEIKKKKTIIKIKRIINFFIRHHKYYTGRQYIETIELLYLMMIFDQNIKVELLKTRIYFLLTQYDKIIKKNVSINVDDIESTRNLIVNLWYDFFH